MDIYSLKKTKPVLSEPRMEVDDNQVDGILRERISDLNLNTRVKHYTLKEVADHCDFHSCWIVIHDRVYDVTDFLHEVGISTPKGSITIRRTPFPSILVNCSTFRIFFMEYKHIKVLGIGAIFVLSA